MTLRPHIPIRSCMGCGGRDDQADLLRIACDADGNLALVPDRRHRGRSGYLHPRPECGARFAARKGPVRSLRRQFDRTVRLRFVEGLELLTPGATRG